MDCITCGKRDDQKPMAFRGTMWCCELHHKIQKLELGADLSVMLRDGVINEDELRHMWGRDLTTGEQMTT